MDPSSSPFREEALRHRARGARQGVPLDVAPDWVRWGFALASAVVVGGVALALFATVGEYATGAALIRADRQVHVTASAAGTVACVEVAPGQRVEAGDVLVRLDDARERCERERADHEFDLQLVKVLGDPGDRGARDVLTRLRVEKEQAAARLAERAVRAPRAGIVSDVRVQPGQALAAGDTILRLNDAAASFSVIAVLPGEYRPRLHPGETLRLELAGYRGRHAELAIEAVGEQVIGPGEVHRFLGPEYGDTLPVAGPVVLVTARLPAPTFAFGRDELRYHDGMQGTVEVSVGAQSVLAALVPGLRTLLRGRDA
jgi:membrane fusion protein (multidrug efflux system)